MQVWARHGQRMGKTCASIEKACESMGKAWAKNGQSMDKVWASMDKACASMGKAWENNGRHIKILNPNFISMA